MRLSASIVRATLIACGVAACAAALSGPSLAQGVAGAARRDAAADAMAAFRAEARAIADQARRAGAVDTTPPVLHVIKVAGKIDAQQVHQAVDAGFELTDDLSGVLRYVISFRSPSGLSHVVRRGAPATPAKRVDGTITIGTMQFADIPFTEFAEPGTWKADLFYAYDANGNFAGYSENELQALGWAQFEVKNEKYDIVAPALVSGEITTPHVRLSKAPKGLPAGTLPYVKAEISMTDSGNGAVSGAYSASLVFCKDWCSESFALDGTVARTGLGSTTLKIGTELGKKVPPGTYEPFALFLDDVAGNESEYDSKAFGGSTDFGDFFPDGYTVVIDD
jgi:hypothetical protein